MPVTDSNAKCQNKEKNGVKDKKIYFNISMSLSIFLPLKFRLCMFLKCFINVQLYINSIFNFWNIFDQVFCKTVLCPQVYYEFPSKAVVETQEGEGLILSPCCENRSSYDNNNNNTNMNSNNNDNKMEEKDNCDCPNNVNVTWHLQVDKGLRS